MCHLLTDDFCWLKCIQATWPSPTWQMLLKLSVPKPFKWLAKSLLSSDPATVILPRREHESSSSRVIPWRRTGNGKSVVIENHKFRPHVLPWAEELALIVAYLEMSDTGLCRDPRVMLSLGGRCSSSSGNLFFLAPGMESLLPAWSTFLGWCSFYGLVGLW